MTTVTERARREGIDARAIAEMEDPAGVLSVYVGIVPGEANTGPHPWEIALKNGLRDVRDAVGDDPDLVHLLDRRLDALGGALGDLTHPSAHGRGRVLFADLSGERTVSAHIDIPLPDLVRLAPRAHIAPLLAALDEGEPVGLVSVARDRVRAVDLAWGTAEQVFEAELDQGTGDWREYAGPAAGDPGPQSSATHRDRFERRLELHRVADVAAAAEPLGAIADRLGWSRMVAGGDPRVVGALTEPLREDGRRVRADEEKLDWTTPSALAEGLGPAAMADRRDERLEWIDGAAEAAAAGGHGATGPEAIAAALERGRVGRLVMDARLAADASPADGEALVRGALATDAQVVVVASTPLSDRLDAHGGAVAALRW